MGAKSVYQIYKIYLFYLLIRKQSRGITRQDHPWVNFKLTENSIIQNILIKIHD